MNLCTSAHVCGEQRSTSGVIPSLPSLSLEARSLSGPRACQLHESDWPSNSRSLLDSASDAPNSKCMQPCPCFTIWILAIKVKFTCLHGKPFTGWAVFLILDKVPQGYNIAYTVKSRCPLSNTNSVSWLGLPHTTSSALSSWILEAVCDTVGASAFIIIHFHFERATAQSDNSWATAMFWVCPTWPITPPASVYNPASFLCPCGRRSSGGF